MLDMPFDVNCPQSSLEKLRANELKFNITSLCFRVHSPAT